MNTITQEAARRATKVSPDWFVAAMINCGFLRDDGIVRGKLSMSISAAQLAWVFKEFTTGADISKLRKAGKSGRIAFTAPLGTNPSRHIRSIEQELAPALENAFSIVRDDD